MFTNNRGDEADFFKAVLEKYNKAVFSFVAYRVRNREDVLNVMQNVFIHLWKYRNDLDSRTESIIFKTCTQEIFKHYKKEHPNTVSIEDLEIQLVDNSEEELNLLLERERLFDSLFAVLNLVPDRRRQIFMMNKLEGKTEKEIAIEMDLSKSAVRNQISKTILFLKKKLVD